MYEILVNSFVEKSKIGIIGEVNVYPIYQYEFKICELNHLQHNPNLLWLPLRGCIYQLKLLLGTQQGKNST